MEGSEIKNAQKQPHRSSLPEAINKTMNTGIGNRMRGTQVIGEMLRNIPGNVAKHSGKCSQTFLGISLKILRNAPNRLAFKFNGIQHGSQFY